MSMNQLDQNQAWIWQPIAMNSQHHHHHQNYNGVKEHMFEKPLTPSDVGKLNRLVIPKQYAEKYFPLDSESGEKGMLLSFDDESGKSWKFRYSYWTSSQSYVLTKGWSRYVKDKKLDAGDAILFERCQMPGSVDDRLYIGCRRRGNTSASTAAIQATALPWSPTLYPTSYYHMNNSAYTSGDEGSSSAAATGNSKRLRLFGVNMECAPDPADAQHLVDSGSWAQL